MQKRQLGRVKMVALAVGLAVTGCGHDGGDAVVARVGERQILKQELRRFVMTLPPGLRTSKRGQEARRDYLQTLIDRELMLLEAEDRGLDEDPALQRRLRRKVEERILSLFRRRELASQVEVTDVDIDEYIADAKLAEERLAEAMLVTTEEQAQRLRAELDQGRSFQELAQELSLDADSGSRSGTVGYVNRLTAPRAGIPTAVFDSLRTGAVSPPLPAGQNWQLVQFVDDRIATDPSLRTGVQSRLAREARQEIEDQLVEQLVHELGWVPAAAGLALLASLDSGGNLIPALTPRQSQTELFTFEGGAATVGDYLQGLREHRVGSPRALSDSGFVVALGKRMLQGRAMLLVASARQRLPEEPGIVQWRAQVHPEMALQALRRQVVGGADTMATEERLRDYYDGRRQAFRVPALVCFDEILFHTREEAEQARGEIGDDAELLELSRLRGNEIRRRRPDGLLCMKDKSKQVLPELWAALDEAPIGQVRGPVSLEGQAFVLIKVVRKEPERPQTFEEARTRAKASVVAGIERQLFADWLAETRQRRQSEVRVFEDRLEAALPEALLAGTATDDEAM